MMSKTQRNILLALLMSVTMGLSFAGMQAYLENKDVLGTLIPASREKQQEPSVKSLENDTNDIYTNNPIARIAEQSSPAVVNIDTESMVTQTAHPFADDPIFKEFFGEDLRRFNKAVPMKGKGSGFIVTKDGYILTNNHVVEGAEKITVTLLDGRQLKAELIGNDPTFDLAVIKVSSKELPVLPMGDSDKSMVGEWVVAIGNPHGFENSVTAGVISGKNRTLQAPGVNFQGFLQTDAAINPGNSGGPLINLRGEVVGINTAIVPYAQGMGFAVPINMAKQVMDDLIKNGEVKHGWLGVAVQGVTPGFAEAYSIPVKEGAVITQVVPDSPADKAALQPGDVIVAIDDSPVKSHQDVVMLVRKHLEGDLIKISFYRDQKKNTVSFKLGAAPAEERSNVRRSKKSGGTSSQTSKRLGAEVTELTAEIREKHSLGKAEGVLVLSVEPESKASLMGIEPGDLVVEVNRKKIRSIRDWEIATDKADKTVVAFIVRNGQTFMATSEN